MTILPWVLYKFNKIPIKVSNNGRDKNCIKSKGRALALYIVDPASTYSATYPSFSPVRRDPWAQNQQ